ncbi:MAG: serine/threonine protein kinase [Planctomycetes bacterium]|nr:serine/threonine protein kinase [Planctomycetota bacterium]
MSPAEQPTSPPPASTPAPASSLALEALVASCLEAELRGDRAGVDALLDAHPHLAPAAREQLADLASSGLLDPLPESIGPYRVRELLGHGGMGEVYLAEQREPVQRQVAVKLVKRGMDTREILARFAAERQALARMNHPAIARVFDAGSTADGRPYFAMEYVAGQPIQSYCDERQLDTQQRLQLFLEVCEGVQHAHLKGILHRDLKPSNLLVAEVDGKPAVKVIDFGIAKAIDENLAGHTLSTARGVLLGTPEYMSPEQAANEGEDLDLRSDVYSLGVVLYELLTGELPFAARKLRRDLPRLREILLSEEPLPPSRRVTDADPDTARRLAQRRATRSELSRRLRGDLDVIALKALARDRAERYASVGELAADLRRHLAHEPVLASSPSRLYRLRKFVRRYRLQVAATSGIFAALLAGLVASSIYRRRAEDSAVRAALALSAEQSARGDAEQQFTRAVLVVDSLLRQVADQRLDGVPQAEPVRRAILEDAARFCAELLAQRREDARTLELSAATHLSLAELARQTLDAAAAERECTLALDLLEGARAPLLTPAARQHGRARAHYLLGRVHGDALRYEEEERSFAEAESALAECLALEPTLAEAQRLRAALCAERAGALLERESAATGAAIDAARAALEEWRARCGPSMPATIQELALASITADHALLHKDLAGARAAIAWGNGVWEHTSAAERTHPLLRAARLDLSRSCGNALLAEQRYAEALPIAQELVEIAEGLAAQHPSVAHYRRSVGYGHGCLGVSYQHLERWEEAQAEFRLAFRILSSSEKGVESRAAELRHVGVYGNRFASMVIARRDATALEEALATIEVAIGALTPERQVASLRPYYLHSLQLCVNLGEHLGRPGDVLAAADQEIDSLRADLDLERATTEELVQIGERAGRAAMLAHFAGAAERAAQLLAFAEPYVQKLEGLAPGTTETRRTRGGLDIAAGLLAAARGDAPAAWRATKRFAEQAGTIGDDTRAIAMQLLLRCARIASGRLRESCLRHVESWCRDELGAMDENPQRFARVLDLPQLRRDFELALGIALALQGDADGALEAFPRAIEGELALARRGFVWLLAQDRLALALELRAELAAEREDHALRDESLSGLAELALPEHALRAAELALRFELPALALELLEARARRRPALPRAALESAALIPLANDERFAALRDSLR